MLIFPHPIHTHQNYSSDKNLTDLFFRTFVISNQKAIFMLQPLAERLRPQNLDEYIGQEHLVGKGAI